MDRLALHQMLEANASYRIAAAADPLAAPPGRRLALITCMDARLDLFGALGLRLGEAHILRNAGGRVTDDVLRSLLLSSHLLGTREFGVIHHTACGLEGISNDELRRRTSTTTTDFLPFDDVDASVVEDVERLRNAGPFPPGTVVWGAVYEVPGGAVRVVVDPVSL
jgi:carbonic anhydrase